MCGDSQGRAGALLFDGHPVVANEDDVTILERRGRRQNSTVELDPVVAGEIFQQQGTLASHQPRVAPRDVLLAQADGVAFLSADRDLVADQRDNNGLAFVILDEEFLHGSTDASPKTTLAAALSGIKRWRYRGSVT